MRLLALAAAAGACAVLGAGVGLVVMDDDEPEGPPRVSIELVLDRGAARIGDLVTATITLRHDGGGPVTVSRTCGLVGRLQVQQGIGPVPASRFTGRLAAFRAAALRSELPPVDLAPPGCAPGEPRPLVLRDGAQHVENQEIALLSRNGSRLEGPITVQGRVEYPFPDPDDAGAEARPEGPTTTNAVTVQMSGGDPGRATPAEALDSALSHPDFARAVLGSDPAGWDGGTLLPFIGQGVSPAPYGIAVVTSRAGGDLDGLLATVDARVRVVSVNRTAVVVD